MCVCGGEPLPKHLHTSKEHHESVPSVLHGVVSSAGDNNNFHKKKRRKEQIPRFGRRLNRLLRLLNAGDIGAALLLRHM